MGDTRDNRWPFFPIAGWLPEYRRAWLGPDLLAGVTLAAYAVPVSLAYVGLAGLPPQMGLYGYRVAGLGYARLRSSRHRPSARRPPSHCSWGLSTTTLGLG